MQRSIPRSTPRLTQFWSLKTQWLWAIALCTLIAILSGLNFSAYYSPSLNSDQAIHVLMAEDLQLPADFYYWGQDRLGSLEPILAHGLLTLLPLRPVVAISIVQYAILIAGFWMFARFFKQPLISIILALVWFLPLDSFVELVLPAHPYRAQFLMVGAALLLGRQLLTKSRPGEALNQPLTLAAIALCAFLAIWISDFSALIFFCLAVVLVLIRLGDRPASADQTDDQTASQTANQTFWQRMGLSRLDLLALGLTSLVGIGFIAFAKSQVMRRNENYGTLSSPDQIWAAATHLAIAAWETLTFQHGPLLGVHAVLVLGSVATMGYLWMKGRSHALRLSPWFSYFLAAAVLSFAALLCLAWVYHNRVSLRYFVPVYLLLWLAALSFLQSLSGPWFRRLGLLLLGTALVSSLTLPNVLSFKRPPSTIARLQPLQTLAPAAFIAQPGGPYLFCAVDPANLDCTPASVNWKAACDADSPLSKSQERLTRISRPRCPRCTRRALAAPTIYAVKGKWLEAVSAADDPFPREMQQFGLCLVKVGEPIQVSKYSMAPYRLKTPKLKTPAPSP